MSGQDGLLVSPGDLAGELAGQEAPVLLDVRWRLGGPPGIDSYREGHLPGAVFVDLDRDLAGPPGAGGRHPLPEPAAFQAAMRAAGVRQDQAVVVYDERDATAAARGWWLLRYFGHEHVRVLDGGYQAWLAAGLPVSTAEPAGEPGDFTARPGHMPVLDAAGASAAGPGRPAARRAGGGAVPGRAGARRPGGRPHPRRGQRADRGQREPGRHLPGRCGSRRPLRRPRRAGRPAATVGAYCGSGVTAAHEILALALAGIPAALYVGSWSDWITDPARPVATGG